MEDDLWKCIEAAERGSRVAPEIVRRAREKYLELHHQSRTSRADKGRDKERDKDLKIISLEGQVKELSDRLSAVAGAKLQSGNPNITDLSDPFRPTKLAEQFKEVYDNEWMNAYDELKKTYSGRHEDDDIPETLANICKNVFELCQDFCQQQLDIILQYSEQYITKPVYKLRGIQMCSSAEGTIDYTSNRLARKHLKDYRKTLSRSSLPVVTDLCCQLLRNKMTSGLRAMTGSVLDYVKRLIELSWLMSVQDPPVVPLWLEKNQEMDRDKFSFYNRSGKFVALTIWPAILLHKDGPLMAKGVVQVLQ